jgi:uncharacterized protein (TIGR02996 family)
MAPDRASWIEAVEANPHDIALRLVFADWLEEQGDDRCAEFVRLQIECDRNPETEAIGGRLEELIRDFCQELADQLPLDASEVSSIQPDCIIRPEDTDFPDRRSRENVLWSGSGEITQFRLTWAGEFEMELDGDTEPEHLADLACSSVLSQVSSLSIWDYGGAVPYGGVNKVLGRIAYEEGMTAFLQSPHLGVRTIRTAWDESPWLLVEDSALQAVASAANLATLRTIDMYGACRVQQDGLEALACSPHVSRLTQLRIANGSDAETLEHSFAAGLSTFLLSPNASQLTTLEIAFSDPVADALRETPYLRELSLLILGLPGVEDESQMPPRESEPTVITELRQHFGTEVEIRLHPL